MERRHRETYILLGLNIAYYRKKKNMTQENLAEAAGISRTHMSNIEARNVDKAVSLEVLLDISDVLGVDIGQLFEVR